jgi:hypothetical protein
VGTPVGVQRYEMALELTYRFRFRGNALFFQPDFQYIIRPAAPDGFPTHSWLDFRSASTFECAPRSEQELRDG